MSAAEAVVAVLGGIMMAVVSEPLGRSLQYLPDVLQSPLAGEWPAVLRALGFMWMTIGGIWLGLWALPSLLAGVVLFALNERRIRGNR